MALAADQLRVQQYGEDAFIGERTQLVFDPESGRAAQKKTVVAQVPVRGGTAVFVQEQIVAQRVAPPAYTYRRYLPQALSYHGDDHQDPNRDRDDGNPLSCCWLICGCLVFLVSLAIIIPIGAVGLISCSPLEGAAITGIVLGVVTLLMSCICCARYFKMGSFLTHLLCCLMITLLLLIFVATLIPNTVFVAQNIELIFNQTQCKAPVVSVAAMGMSYTLLPLFGFFCLCSTILCCNKLSKQ